MPITGTNIGTVYPKVFTLEATTLLVDLPLGYKVGKINLEGTDTNVTFTNAYQPLINIPATTQALAPKYDFALIPAPEVLDSVAVNLYANNGVIITDYTEGVNIVQKASNLACTFKPLDGYEISSIWVNNIKQSIEDKQVYNLVLTDLQENKTIYVSGKQV
jgi:hypothetical protein